MKKHELCAIIIPFNIKIKGFRILTGTSAQKSSRGNVYGVAMYDCYSNAILVEPIKNRHAATICNAFINIHKFLRAIGSDPKVYSMDNKCSSDLKEAMRSYEIDSQMDPLHMHRIKCSGTSN